MTQQPQSQSVKAVRRQEGAVIVDAMGDIDINCSTEFQQALLGLFNEKPELIVVNLAEVPYMDSSGVASLVKLLSRAKKSGVRLRLVAMTERVRSIFEITRLDTVFEIFATEQEALT